MKTRTRANIIRIVCTHDVREVHAAAAARCRKRT